jgi:CRISPR-associated RAMP protein (TIGR02581 family)
MTVVDSELCVTKEMMDRWRQEQRGMDPLYPRDRWLATQVWDHSCRVCRVFGSPWLASRVRIADLHPPEGARVAIERRDGVAIHREEETVQHKYDFETVPLGNRFALRISGENLSDAERGLLWLGLRELGDGAILLGGFKGRGLGQVRLADLTLQGVDMTNSAARREYILGGTMSDLGAQTDSWLAALWAELEKA